MRIFDISSLTSLKSSQWEAIFQKFAHITLTIFGAFVASSLVSGLTTMLIIGASTKNQRQGRRQSPQAISMAAIPLTNLPNYRNIRKAVMDRNIFNSEGTFPDEGDLDAQPEDEGDPSSFQPNAPCVDSSLKLKLVGTIVIGPDSVASVLEKGYSSADSYKIGDSIIGNEEAVIYAIERNRVIINNNGAKECLELEIADLKASNYGNAGGAPVERSPDPIPPEDSGEEVAQEAVEEPEGDAKVISLDSAWVEAQLGPGGGKIVNDARLVPHMVKNQVDGFKIFAIKPSSLFTRIGLKNGDIIQSVNDTSLKQAEQGFALFQALQEERDITINFKRKNSKQSVQVRIK